MPEQHEMAGLTTNPGMDTEIQADVSLHSADMPDRSFEARLLEQVTCRTPPLDNDSPFANKAKTSAPESSTTP